MSVEKFDEVQVGSQPASYRVEVCAPADAPALLREQFMALVLKGGEVQKSTLPALVSDALVIAFVWQEQTLAAVGGVKRPNAGYRAGVFDKAGLSDAAHYPYELGWIFVEERFRRMGMAGALTTCLVHGLEEWPVYASSRTNNKGMHKALVNSGFRQVGQHYPGRRTGEEFQVFLKPAG